MVWIGHLVVIGLVTAAALFALTRLPFGIAIDHWKKLLTVATIVGVLNAVLDLLLPAAFAADNPATLFFLAVFFNAIVNGLVLAIAALLMEGVRLRHSFWSAFWGAIALGSVNAWVFRLLPSA